MPHYNVMGVAKAALEASVRYLAVDLGAPEHPRQRDLAPARSRRWRPRASAISAISCSWNQYNSPLKRNVTIEEVGGAGLYLLSDLAAGVTGEVHHVDCGYHVVGMKAVRTRPTSPSS